MLHFPDLHFAIGNPSLQEWPLSFGERLVGCHDRGDPPRPPAEGAVGRRWRRRGEPPAASRVVAARACGRRVSDACMRPGELGAGVPRAAQLAHILGAGVHRICTTGRAVVAFAGSFRAEREREGASRARAEDAECRTFMCVVGRLIYTVGRVWVSQPACK